MIHGQLSLCSKMQHLVFLGVDVAYIFFVPPCFYLFHRGGVLFIHDYTSKQWEAMIIPDQLTANRFIWMWSIVYDNYAGDFYVLAYVSSGHASVFMPSSLYTYLQRKLRLSCSRRYGTTYLWSSYN